MSESEFIVDANPENFNAAVVEQSQRVPVLLDFWADWCEPCKTLTPILTKLAEEYQGRFILAKVNADEQQQLTQHLGIKNLPTVKLLKDGQIVDEFNGALPEGQIREFLDKYVDAATASDSAQIFAMIEAGEIAAADAQLQSLIAIDPDNKDIPLAKLKITFANSDFDAFDEQLNALPEDVRKSTEVTQMEAAVTLARASGSSESLDELREVVESGSADSETQYNYAMQLVQASEHEAALEQLLSLMKTDPDYNEGAARKGLLSIFDMLGSGPVVAKYRRQLFAMLH